MNCYVMMGDSLYLTYYPIVKEIGEAKTAFEIIRKEVRPFTICICNGKSIW